MITTQHPVLLEGDRQPVRRCSRQTGCLLKAGEIVRRAGQGAQDQDPFVKHSDAAYTVHGRECYPKS